MEKGYSETDIAVILQSKDMTTTLLNRDYNEHILGIMSEKYYLKKNLEKYLEFKKENPDKKNNEIISMVNISANIDWYDTIKPTDLSKGNLILVNKYNYLPDNYEIEDLVDMSIQVSFQGKQIKKEVYEAFYNMSMAARKENLKIVANSAYRDYEYQSTLYKRYKNNKGQAYADKYAARPGHSEHQTGLSIDVSTLNSSLENFHETDEYKWLIENAHKYGFILRYPENKEHLTGYNYESWHYRYVGVDVATQIKNEDITFDEYYAYYVEG
jgi:D-alanyl-D-alanine carboxypeptidase